MRSRSTASTSARARDRPVRRPLDRRRAGGGRDRPPADRRDPDPRRRVAHPREHHRRRLREHPEVAPVRQRPPDDLPGRRRARIAPVSPERRHLLRRVLRDPGRDRCDPRAAARRLGPTGREEQPWPRTGRCSGR